MNVFGVPKSNGIVMCITVRKGCKISGLLVLQEFGIKLNENLDYW